MKKLKKPCCHRVCILARYEDKGKRNNKNNKPVNYALCYKITSGVEVENMVQGKGDFGRAQAWGVI